MNTLALDMGGTKIKAGLVDENYRVHAFREVPSHAEQGGKIFLSSALALCKMYDNYGKIGISVTGQTRDGVIWFANENVPHFTGTDVKGIFEAECNVPVAVENDVNAAAIGEMALGAGKRWKDVLCLTYGTGIGGALVIDGKLCRGWHGGAGEVGHIVTHAGGHACACGLSGCYEQYASVNALVNRGREIMPECGSGRDVLEAVRENLQMRQVLSDWMDEVCYGLTSLVHTLQPEGVILGGGIMEAQGLAEAIEKRMETRVMKSYRQTRFVKAQLGNRAGLLGAALYANGEKGREHE